MKVTYVVERGSFNEVAMLISIAATTKFILALNLSNEGLLIIEIDLSTFGLLNDRLKNKCI